MLTCPHCGSKIVMKELGHPELFKNYRICPGCNGKFTPDLETRYRQAICILVAIVSLVLTIMLHFDGTEWLIPAVISYLFLGLLVYWGNKHIFLVPYVDDHESSQDS